MTTNQREKIEKEFDEAFQTYTLDGVEVQAVRTGIKSFLFQALEQHEKEILGELREEVEKLKKDPTKAKCEQCGGQGSWESCEGHKGVEKALSYNKALSDIKNLIIQQKLNQE